MDVNVVVTAIMVWIFTMIFVFEFQVYDLHKRIMALEQEVCIYFSPKIKEIAEEATLKEGDV